MRVGIVGAAKSREPTRELEAHGWRRVLRMLDAQNEGACGMNTKTIRELLQKDAPWKNHGIQEMDRKIVITQSRAPAHKWFCIDRDQDRTVAFVPAMPLCYHRGER